MASSADPKDKLIASLEDRLGAMERDLRLVLTATRDAALPSRFIGSGRMRPDGVKASNLELVNNWAKQELARERQLGLSYDELVQMGIEKPSPD